MDKKKVLITGATGLVGSHMLEKLADEYHLHALVRVIPKHCNTKVTYIEMDLAQECMTSDLPKKMDAIVHLAQSNKIREFPISALDVYNVNVNTTALLLDWGQKVGISHFIYASTGGIYGAAKEPISETQTINLPKGPLAYYFTTKYASEQLIKAYSDCMVVQILRPFFIYGKNQKKEMFIPRLIDNIHNERAVILQGGNGISVNPIHVDDVVNLIDICLNTNASLTMNVAGPDVLSIKEIAEIIGAQIGKKPIYQQNEEFSDNIIGNNDQMINLLKKPLRKFSTAISDLVSN